ncbi:MAG: hypothetical protein LRY62_02875 [Alphaproteobacteria bacterium]|nr:hypothetical protein [Alphaproteobacteria bacterium]
MGGSVPVWETPHQQQQHIEQRLTAAVTGDESRSARFETALAYHTVQGQNQGEPLQEFGFGDVIDMVNPLQHIPIVGHVYRELTGDTIKPIAQIVGGAVFGGPLGAAGGLVNTIIKEETGRDITANAMALAEGEKIAWRSERPPATRIASVAAAPPSPYEPPEQRLTRAVQEIETAAYRDLPASMLGFADTRAAVQPRPPEPQPPSPASWRQRERYND